MYTVMVGMEVLSNVGQMNKRADALLLEMLEGLAKAQLNINKVDRQFTELDHRMEVLEESHRHYQQFLLIYDQCQRTQDREIGVLRTRCDGLVRTDRVLNQELGQYQELVLIQTQIINAQNAYLWELEKQVKELWEAVFPEVGRTLGNPILIEDDVEVREEIDPRSPRSHNVVTTLI